MFHNTILEIWSLERVAVYRAALCFDARFLAEIAENAEFTFNYSKLYTLNLLCHVSHVLHGFGKLKLGKTLAENAENAVFTINFKL